MSLTDEDWDEIDAGIVRALEHSLDKSDSQLANCIRDNVEMTFEDRVRFTANDIDRILYDTMNKFEDFKAEIEESQKEMQAEFDDKVAELEDAVADLKKENHNLESELESFKLDIKDDVRDLDRKIQRVNEELHFR